MSIVIEEVDIEDVQEEELLQFEETKPLQIHEILTDIGEGKESNKPNSDLLKDLCGQDKVLDLLAAEVEDDDEGDEDNEDVYVDKDNDNVAEQKYSKQPQFANEALKSYDGSDVEPDDHDDEEPERQTRTKRNVLDKFLRDLMGQANLSYAKNEMETAENLCFEIIRQNPNSSEPFLTLADIYEMRDRKKFINFLALAAFATPSDHELCLRAAKAHLEEGNSDLANKILLKSLRAYPRKSMHCTLQTLRAQIYEKKGEINTAMFIYFKMIRYIPKTEAELCLNITNTVVSYYTKFQTDRHNRYALKALENAYEICGKPFKLMNVYIELLITCRSYSKALNLLAQNRKLRIVNNPDGIPIHVDIPHDLDIGIRLSICVCLIHSNVSDKFLEILLKDIRENVPLGKESFKFYTAVGEALLKECKYYEVLELLEPLVETKERENSGPLWLLHAEALRFLNRIDEAIASYMQVIIIVPSCDDARLTLSALLKQQGRHWEAAQALEPKDLENNHFNARMLYERCLLLKQCGCVSDYLELGYILLSRYSIKFRNREEIAVIAKGGCGFSIESIKTLSNIREFSKHADPIPKQCYKQQLNDGDLNVNDEFILFEDLVRTAFELKMFSLLQKTFFAMIGTKRFTSFRVDLEPIALFSSYFNDDCAIAFSFLRELITKNPDNMTFWNMLSLLVQKGQSKRYHRFICRFEKRVKDKKYSPLLPLFRGHYYLYCCSFKYALKTYMELFKKNDDPILPLCIVTSFNQISLQKKVVEKTIAVTQAIAFAYKYAKLRGGTASVNATDEECSMIPVQQEIYYNLGRLYHQAGINHLAIAYYKRALELRHELIETNESFLGLKHEIAYNLHLLYRVNGNIEMARQVLYKYCVI